MFKPKSPLFDTYASVYNSLSGQKTKIKYEVIVVFIVLTIRPRVIQTPVKTFVDDRHLWFFDHSLL